MVFLHILNTIDHFFLTYFATDTDTDGCTLAR